MSELIFHHYDDSPFSETIRLCFGHKGLAWRSVIQPQIMPKPHLVPLTGGYRKIPVLQRGADVFCDSQLIARGLEHMFPSPTLFPGGSEGICFATKFWADRLLFMAAVPVLFAKIGPAVPEAFIEDRKKLMGGGDFRAMMAAGPLFADQLRAHAQLLDAQLADGRRVPARRRASRSPTPPPTTRSGSCSRCRPPRAPSTSSRSCSRGPSACAPSDTASAAR